MSTNFTGDPLTNLQIANYALQLRRFHGLDDLKIPDVVTLLNRDTILTRFGIKQFSYKVVPDEELEGDEAITLITESNVRLRISQTTYDRAAAIDRRARWTVAHEFGHGALHKNTEPLARARQAATKRIVPAFVSVERQADVFASVYLVTDAMAKCVNSAADLASMYLISTKAADIRWEEEYTRRNRSRIQAGLRALSDELRNTGNPQTKIKSNLLLCPVCSQRTLMAIGGKYICHGSCNRILDSFPDGDDPLA